MKLAQGTLSKMKVRLNDPVEYELSIGDQQLSMNALIGESLQFKFSGDILCMHCGRKTKKSFNQGYCYPCFTSLALCDTCILRPELCHFDQGTCREPEWGKEHCMIDHIVYLANSSGVKVGITRHTQVPIRWIDQGATQALPIFRVKSRLQAGLMEVIFKSRVSDRTSWQKMLKGVSEEVDLSAVRDEIVTHCKASISEIEQRFADYDIRLLDDEDVLRIEYPVNRYPEKVKSLNFDKTPEISGNLMGIKGQYLIFDNGVLNVRKFGAYDVLIEK